MPHYMTRRKFVLRFQSFLSSSSGNCTFITDGETNILIDCGANGKYITECLDRIDVSPDSINAILVTHEHRDHTLGVGILSRKYDIDIFASEDTWRGMEPIIGKVSHAHINSIQSKKRFLIGALEVTPFSIPHDAKGAVGYKLTSEGKSMAIATDTGHISDELFNNLKGCESVIVEANHDINMLRQGRYPFPLKRRILSEIGHLSNDDCGRLCAMLAKTGTKALWLGHLSKENNLPELAYKTVKDILEEQNIRVGNDVCLNVLPPTWI